MGGTVLKHVPRVTPTHSITFPGASTGGETEARPHSQPPTSPHPGPRPPRGDAGGREGAGRELALRASPAGATGPAPPGSGQWDETGSTQADAHTRVGVWHPERAGNSSRRPQSCSLTREDGAAPSPLSFLLQEQTDVCTGMGAPEAVPCPPNTAGVPKQPLSPHTNTRHNCIQTAQNLFQK